MQKLNVKDQMQKKLKEMHGELASPVDRLNKVHMLTDSLEYRESNLPERDLQVMEVQNKHAQNGSRPGEQSSCKQNETVLFGSLTSCSCAPSIEARRTVTGQPPQ